MKNNSKKFLIVSENLKDSSQAAQHPLNQNMKYTHKVIDNIRPMLQVALKMADSTGSNEIHISKARAKEILQMAIAADKEIEKSFSQPSHFTHLDNIFCTASSMNNALAKSLK